LGLAASKTAATPVQKQLKENQNCYQGESEQGRAVTEAEQGRIVFTCKDRGF